MTSTESIRTCNVFRHLTIINLHIDPQNGKAQWKWPRSLDRGNVALVLNAAKGLKHLDLGFNIANTEIPEIAKLLGPLTWPSLRCLGLTNMFLEEDELITFLTRHIGTLESISSCFMSPFKHHPQDLEFADWIPDSRKCAFRSMSALTLTELCIYSNGGLHPVRGHWHSDDRAKFNHFLASGGDA